MFQKLTLPENKTVDYLRIEDRKVGIVFSNPHANDSPLDADFKLRALIWTPDYFLQTERALWKESVRMQIFQPVPANNRELPTSIRGSLEASFTHAMLGAICNDYRKAHPEYGERRELDIYGKESNPLPKHVRGYFWKKAVNISQGMLYKIIDDMPEEHLAILKATRRFGPAERSPIYAWLSEESLTSNRCLQLIDTAPIAAYRIATSLERSWDPQKKALALEATTLVHEGIKVKQLMDVLRIPRWCMMVKPRHVMWVNEHLWQNERMYNLNAGRIRQAIDLFPDKRSLGRLWKTFAEISGRNMGEEHFYWVLSHMWDLAGDPDIYDVCDYFSALYDEEIRRNLGYQVGDEPWKDWNPRMNLETTMQRCELWHQDAGQDHWGGRAKRYTGPFPEPWLDGMKKGAFEIMPIINGADLHEEGKRMHHCVSGYSKMVLHGECYIYSVRKKDKRVATLEIIKNKGFNDPVQTYKVVQSRGPCNADPSKEVKKLIDDWMVKSNKKQWQKAREQDGKRL